MSILLALFLVGAGTGWLVGLSFSPVVGSVVGSILGLAGAVVAAAAGVPLKDRSPIGAVRAEPLAALVVGIALLAPVGVIARDYGWFAPSVEEQARRALVLRESGVTGAADEGSGSGREGGGLFGRLPAGTCARLLRTADSELGRGFEATGDEVLAVVAEVVVEPEKLAAIRDALCPPG